MLQVQLTVSALLRVKDSTSNVTYDLSRILNLQDGQTITHDGALNSDVIQGIALGLVQQVTCQGPASALAEHFDVLLNAFRSPHCTLMKLVLAECDWPAGRPLSELLDALAECGGTLKYLSVESMPAGGQLPASFFERCPWLQFCDLDNMGLTGPIPQTIGRLTRVQKLLLWGNSFEGPIPEELGQCAQLQQLEAQKNKLSGPIPTTIGQCKQLRVLVLYENQLCGSIPETLGYCVNLQELYLNDNQLTGPVPKEIGSCILLQQLELETNQLSGPIPGTIFQCVELSSLHLHSNLLSGPIPKEIGQCTLLQDVVLHTNKLSGEIPDTVGQCVQLVELSLHGNELSGPVPETIAQCVQLESLTLANNQLSGRLPTASLSKLRKLEVLQLFGNNNLIVTNTDKEQLVKTLPRAQIHLPNFADMSLADRPLVESSIRVED